MLINHDMSVKKNHKAINFNKRLIAQSYTYIAVTLHTVMQLKFVSPDHASAMVTSTSTPGSMLIEV